MGGVVHARRAYTLLTNFPLRVTPVAGGFMDSASTLPPQVSIGQPSWRINRAQLTAGLVVLALAVRCVGLTLRPLWLDEAFTGWFTSQSWHYLWTVLPTYEAHPPFYYSLLKLWRLAFGGEALALRSFSVLFSVATIPVVIAAAFEHERLTPSGRPLLAAGVAAFLAACSPMLVILGQEARSYPLLTFAFAVAVLGLLRLMVQFRDGKPGDWPSWLLLGVGTEVTLWSHSLGLLYSLCLAIALAPSWLRSPITRSRLGRGLAVAAGVALLYLPCLLLVMGRAHDWGTNWLAWEPWMLLQLFVIYSVPIEAMTVASAVAALAMLLLIKRGLASAIAARGWNADRALLLLWLGPPLLAAIVSTVFVPIFLARTLVGTLVPAYLMIGAAVARSDSQRERTLLTAAMAITLLVTAFQVATRLPAERWDLAAAYLRRNVAPQDQVWIYPSDSAIPLDRLGPRPGVQRLLPAPFPTMGVTGPIRAGWPAMVSLTPEQARKLAEDPALKDVRVIWLVTRQSGIFDPDNDMPSALARVRNPGPIQEWGYINARPYYRR
jgi:mannosyltransferase